MEMKYMKRKFLSSLQTKVNQIQKCSWAIVSREIVCNCLYVESNCKKTKILSAITIRSYRSGFMLFGLLTTTNKLPRPGSAGTSSDGRSGSVLQLDSKASTKIGQHKGHNGKFSQIYNLLNRRKKTFCMTSTYL